MTLNKMEQAKIFREVQKAFDDAVMIAANECTKIISTPQSWEGFSDIRDIVDLGQLRASQRVTLSSATSQSGKRWTGLIEYTAAYAAAVHNGATIRYSNGRTRRIPARPFMEQAIKQQPPMENMKKLLG